MAKNIETLAKKLGATVVGTVPDYSAGAFGIAALAITVESRLFSSPSGAPACSLGREPQDHGPKEPGAPKGRQTPAAR